MDKDLVAAVATPLVLTILAQERNYGYGILRRVREISDGDLQWADGMLYPLLHRLERLGHITAQWARSPEGRRRRYYEITADGRAALARYRREWSTAATALSRVWGATPGTIAWT